ncbi:MAG: thiamine-phosphate kinase [Nocardioidaceae bacterium]
MPSPVTSPASSTVADLGEFDLIAAVVARCQEIAPLADEVEIGPGDDAAVLSASGRLAISADLLVAGRHFRLDWSSAEDVGHKAVAQNLADIAAMGGRGRYLTVGLVLPPDTESNWVLELATGMAEECALAGASIIGGDITAGDQLTIAVSVTGILPGAPITRSGAAAGDAVALCGQVGWAAAGLAVLGRGFRSPRVVVEAHRRPQPPYAAGPEAYELGATAMIDVSDGLVADAGHIARASGVHVDLDPDAFEIPEPLHAVAAATGADPLEFILGGGEDHALLATFPAGTALPGDWRVIGQVKTGEGVTVAGKEYDGPTGWRHF